MMLKKLVRIKYYKKGDYFGKFKFIKETQEHIIRGSWMRFGIFQCHCGNKIERDFKSIRKKTDCGCGLHDRMIAAAQKHGLRYHKYYSVYRGIMARCYNKNNKRYNNYGGRGISFYWKDDIKGFIVWLELNLPDRKYGESIDRINVNGNYEPGNLRWANSSIQANNKTNNHIIQFNGISYTLNQLSKIIGVCSKTLSDRYKRGLRNESLTENFRDTINLLDIEILCFEKKIIIRDLVDKKLIPRGTLYERYYVYGIDNIGKMVEKRLSIDQINTITY